MRATTQNHPTDYTGAVRHLEQACNATTKKTNKPKKLNVPFVVFCPNNRHVTQGALAPLQSDLK